MTKERERRAEKIKIKRRNESENTAVAFSGNISSDLILNGAASWRPSFVGLRLHVHKNGRGELCLYLLFRFTPLLSKTHVQALYFQQERFQQRVARHLSRVLLSAGERANMEGERWYSDR